MSTKHSRRKSAGRPSTRGLRIVALFEGAKGLLVLLAGFGLLSFIHRDIHEAAAGLVRHLHLNPASHYPLIFLELSGRIGDTHLWGMALAAAIYALVRLIEAAGLWNDRGWAEWFGALSGGIYLPVEVFEVARGVSWPKVTVIAVNLGVVCYLLQLIIRDRRQKTARRI